MSDFTATPDESDESMGAAPPRRPAHAAEQGFGRAFKASLGLHGAALALILFKSLVFPTDPKPYVPSLRVDMVALPDVLKKDLSNAPPTASDKEIADALKRAEADARNIKPIKLPDPPKAKEAEKAAPDEMVLKPKKAKESDKPAEKKLAEKHKEQKDEKHDPSRDLKLKGALARIKALSQISESDAPSRSNIVKGNRLSKGTSLSGDARENSGNAYPDSVRERLSENWTLPVWLSRQNYSARVVIYLDSRGRVRNVKFIKTSGNEQFDSAVRKAIDESAPFAPPPEEIASSVLVNGLGFAFPL